MSRRPRPWFLLVATLLFVLTSAAAVAMPEEYQDPGTGGGTNGCTYCNDSQCGCSQPPPGWHLCSFSCGCSQVSCWNSCDPCRD